jgi:hypothetical protein
MTNNTVQSPESTQSRLGKAGGPSALRIKTRGFGRTMLCVAAFALWLGLPSTAAANHHKVTLLDASVCSADPSVQHVRVRMDDFDEHFWENCMDLEFFDANSTQVDSFRTPHDLTSGANVIVDIGTAAYAASSGTTLDMVLPADNIMISNGQVCLRGSGLEHPLPEDFSCKDVDQCVNVSVISCSVASVCGDGVLDAGEQCDDGGTAAGDCCSATCQFESATTTCRAAAGTCDVAETCDGTSAICPSDVKHTSVCRAAAGECDVAESCDGVTNTCPADDVESANTTCRAATGACDVAESCDGVTDTCPADSVASATTTCRAAAGSCDLAETCDGTTTTCPSDQKNTAVCRAATGACDVAESCDGVTDTCPADSVASATTTCRAAAGECDLAETCDGTTTNCPGDAKNTGVCRTEAGACDVAESCDGVTNTCPADSVASANTSCRAAAGECDLAETCDGTTANCPSDEKNTGVCRTEAGECDVAESCDGITDTCPSDQFDSALCDDGVYCNGDETCNAGLCETGASPQCTGLTPFCDESAQNCSACLVDIDCSNGTFCDGTEICNAGVCGSGAVPACESPTPLCDETLAVCVECQSDLDCAEGKRCEAQVCLGLITTPINVPSASPTVLFLTALMFCTTAFAVMARR